MRWKRGEKARPRLQHRRRALTIARLSALLRSCAQRLREPVRLREVAPRVQHVAGTASYVRERSRSHDPRRPARDAMAGVGWSHRPPLQNED